MNVLVGIPAYNEAKVIGDVINSIPEFTDADTVISVLVVDDGSSDQTAFILKKLKVKVISHLINRGLGGALKTLFEYSKVHGFDILVTLDADGQHSGKDIKKIIEPIQSGK